MSDWRNQLYLMHKNLEEKEILHDTLISIDKKIINGESIEQILRLGYKKLCLLTNSDYIEFHVGKSIISYSSDNMNCNDFDSFIIHVDEDEDNWETYIDRVKIFSRKEIFDPKKYVYPDIKKENYRESIENISRQLNIAINNIITRNISNLYKEIIEKFSYYGDVNLIFDTICKEITSIFPSITGLSNFDKKLMNIQIALFVDDNKNKLKIVGSNNNENIGGILTTDKSICAAIFKYINKDELPYGYKKARYKDKTYVYFMGNPNRSELYQKVTVQPSQSELSVPLFKENGDAIGVINLEALPKNMFMDTHAKALIYNSTELAVLIDNIWRLSSGRKHVVQGFFSNIERYIGFVLREYKHSIGHPLQTLSKASFDIQENCESSDKIIKLLDEVHHGIDVNKEILTDALTGMVERKNSINLYKKIVTARGFIESDLIQEEIEFTIEKDSAIDMVALDNLFPQYLYSLFHNSISSIIMKKMRLANDKAIDYKPQINISISAANQYNISNQYDISTKNQADSSQKCRIVIYDNGDGIDQKYLADLSRYKVSHQNRSGTGLYSFKQYLILHNGRIIKIDSKLHEYFYIDFVVDIA